MEPPRVVTIAMTLGLGRRAYGWCGAVMPSSLYDAQNILWHFSAKAVALPRFFFFKKWRRWKGNLNRECYIRWSKCRWTCQLVIQMESLPLLTKGLLLYLNLWLEFNVSVFSLHGVISCLLTFEMICFFY